VSNQDKSSTICKKNFAPIHAPGNRRFLSFLSASLSAASNSSKIRISGDGVVLPMICGLPKGRLQSAQTNRNPRPVRTEIAAFKYSSTLVLGEVLQDILSPKGQNTRQTHPACHPERSIRFAEREADAESKDPCTLRSAGCIREFSARPRPQPFPCQYSF
jgi:hypothetical protein